MDKEQLEALRVRYAMVLERLDKALAASCRTRDEVCLVAVSKLHGADMVAALAAMGQRDFGENYVQEARAKRSDVEHFDPELAGKLRWHMIGHVQTRKAAQVAGAFALVQSLDSEKLALELEKRCTDLHVTQKVLIEVNVGEEASKTGLARSELPALLNRLQEDCPHIEPLGFMCIPPVFDAGEAARPYFALLRTIAERAREATGLALPELSMGMSGDFEWAVAEGATMVRVGTDIFGPR